MPRFALVDCNNFFVSCERVFRPDLWRRPVAVLSNNDGCIIARSDEVKALRIEMGVPLFQVKSIVKTHGINLFSANFELYGDMSQRILAVLRDETPLIEVYSIDECFIDVSQLPVDDFKTWAKRVRDRCLSEVGIPVSIGVASTKTLAKVASTYAKKHGGTYVIDSDNERVQLLKELPIESVWGIGYRMAPKLHDKGVSKAIQLTEASDAWLEQQFNITGMRMIRELRGEPQLGFGDKHDARKTIMRSRSFGYNVRTYHQLESAVATFAAQAGVRLRAQETVARGIATFLMTSKHATQQRRASTITTFAEATSDTAKLITGALQALEAIYDPEFAYQKAGVVLLGIDSVEAWQLSLMADEEKRDERLDLMRAMDLINKRYGNVVWHASEKPKDADWHSKRELQSPRYTTMWQGLPALKAR